MTKYIDAKALTAFLSNPGAAIPNSTIIDLDAVNKMPPSQIGEWLEDRYTMHVGQYELKIDCLGFPLGVVYRGAQELIIDHNDYPISLHMQANDDYRVRFNAVLREKLEEKITKISQEKPDLRSARFLHHGLDLILSLPLTNFSDIPLRLARTEFDIDYYKSENPDERAEPLNLYVDAIRALSTLKLGLTQDFWDKVAEDPRRALVISSIMSKDFTFKEQLDRMVCYWDKLREMDRLIYSAEIFGTYCRGGSYEGGTTPIPDRIAEIERIIKEEISADKQELLLRALEISLQT